MKSACDSVNEPAIIPSASIMKDNVLATPEPEGDIISDTEPATKKPRTADNNAKTVWLKLEKITFNLTWCDKEVISDGMELNDHHINYYQCLLKKQFPLIGGLLLTLLHKAKYCLWTTDAMKKSLDCGI